MSIKANCSFQLWYLSLTWWSYKVMKSLINIAIIIVISVSLTHSLTYSHQHTFTHSHAPLSFLLTVSGNSLSHSLAVASKGLFLYLNTKKNYIHTVVGWRDVYMLIPVRSAIAVFSCFSSIHYLPFQTEDRTRSEKDQSEKHSI